MTIVWYAVVALAGAATWHRLGNLIMRRVLRCRETLMERAFRDLPHDSFARICRIVDNERNRRQA